MKSIIVSLKNRYPNALVISQLEGNVDVFDLQSGDLLCAVRGGQDAQELGARDQFSLEPIPKEARVHKMDSKGWIGLDEMAAERKEARKPLIHEGRVKSQAQLDKEKKAEEAAAKAAK